MKVIEHTLAATGFGRNAVCKIKDQKVVDQLQVKPTDKRKRNMSVGDEFISIIRRALYPNIGSKKDGLHYTIYWE